MEEYIKLFNTHAEYIAYINGEDSIFPNISYCEDNEEVHYNPSEESVRHFISIDKLPGDCCDEDTGELLPYDYEISEEDYIVNHYLPLVRDPNYSDVYEYVGEYMYNSNKYYMWEIIPGENGIVPTYILTTQKSFQGQTVRDNIQNRNCPVYVGLDYDLEIYKERQDYTAQHKIIFDEWKISNAEDEKSVITTKFNITDVNNPTKLLTEETYIYYFNKMEIDGIVQPNIINDYQFDTIGEHIIKYTLKNPKDLSHIFNNCYHLTSVVIPNSVTTIGQSAFSGCSGLTSVVIPNSVISIGNNAFDYCRSLTSLTIPDSVTSIGEYAFFSCGSLTSLTIPNSVTSIKNNAFGDCTGLISVTIGNSVTSIGGSAFSHCTSLTSVTIPNSVISIGSGVFSSCSGLTSIRVESENSQYDSRNNCNAIIETASNTLIAGCKNTVIPNSVTKIGDYAFSVCSGLTSITIPNSVTTIGEHAFGDCSGLTSITIPNSVTSIGWYAFGHCSSLISIICNATIAPIIHYYTFKDVKTGGTLTVPIGSTGYDTWMSISNYYLGKYNWTKVEQ